MSGVAAVTVLGGCAPSLLRRAPPAPLLVVPLELRSETWIFATVSLGGQAVDALIDTGAEMSVIDAGFARELSINLGNPVTALGTGGQAAANFVEVELGWTEAMAVARRIVAIDLSAVSAAMGVKLPIILGKDVLAEHVLDLDIPRGLLRLWPDRVTSSFPDATVLPLNQSGPLASVHVELEGVALLLDLDTGSGGALSLYPTGSERLGLPDDRKVSTVLAGGVGGLNEVPILTLSELNLGNARLRDLPTVLLPDDAARGANPAHGSMGMEVLRRFRLLVDLPAGQMSLPTTGDLQAPFWKNRLGFSMNVKNGSNAVSHVMPASPAERSGMMVGDQIISIRGEPAVHMDQARFRTLAGSEGRGVTAVVTHRRRHEITASEFY